MNIQTHSSLAGDDNRPVTPGQAGFPSFWISIGWIGMYFGLQILFGLVVCVIAVVSNPNTLGKLMSGEISSNDAFLGQLALPMFISVLLSGLVTLAILWWHLKKDSRQEKIGLFTASRLSLLKTIGLSIALMVAVTLLSEAYARYVVPGQELQAGVNQLIAGIPKTAFTHMLLFVTIAVIAPVLEEVLFRGYLQTSLMQHMKPWLAILVASATFGAVHLQPFAFPVLTALGAVFGYLYHKTGSLKVNIILHVINNGIAYILMAMGLSSGV
jgi:hypothetical protein